MNGDVEGLIELASSISDGVPIDWDQLEPDADNEALRRRQSSLRIIATVAKIHRGASADATSRELQFWGRLEIRQKIGRGAFGSVYRAWDPDLQREVALKLASSGVGRQAAAMNEARALARVRHSNVVTIHGVDRHDDKTGLWMDLIRGRTLERILNDQGPLGGREVALVAIEVCRALAAVHAKGLVHGDVKAQNVMREEGGRIVLMDFGLVRKGNASSSKQSTRAGTPAYMAPELHDGAAATMQSDIYAVGVLIYHLVTGAFPASGASRQTESNPENPRSLHDLRPDLPENLVHTVERALASQPQSRFTTAGEMMRALSATLGSEPHTAPVAPKTRSRRYIVGAVIATAAVIIGAAALLSPSLSSLTHKNTTSRGSESQPVAITILPFDNLSADPSTDYLSEGIADDITSSLTRMKMLRVVPGSRASHRISAHEQYSKLAQELGVAALLAGNFRKSGRKIRVDIQLIDTRSNSFIWSQAYERDVNSISGLQAEISNAVLHHIAAQFGSALAAEVPKQAIPNAEAYELYLYGRFLIKKRSADDLKKAINYFNNAVTADPAYAPAYSGLADCYSLLVEYGAMRARDGMPPAKRAALKAIELDDSLAEAHTSLGFIDSYGWDWSGAEKNFLRALQLEPDNPTAHAWYARFLRQVGHVHDAVAEGEHAVDLDKTSLPLNTSIGALLYYAGRYTDAEKQLLKTLQLDAHYPLAHFWLGWVYLRQGRFKEAVAESTQATAASQELGEVLAAAAYAESGKRAEALNMIRTWEERRAQGTPVAASSIALVYSTLKEKELTFKWLNQAYDERDISLLVAQSHPAYDWLRSDTRFTSLFRRMGLPYKLTSKPGV